MGEYYKQVVGGKKSSKGIIVYLQKDEGYLMNGCVIEMSNGKLYYVFPFHVPKTFFNQYYKKVENIELLKVLSKHKKINH